MKILPITGSALVVCLAFSFLSFSASDDVGQVAIESSEWKDGMLVFNLKAGQIKTTDHVGIAEFSKLGNRNKGVFSEGLNVSGKAVCRVQGRDGKIQSIWFYYNGRRIELQRAAGEKWEGKDFKADGMTLF